MHLKDVLIKCAIVAAIGAVIWLGLSFFGDTADDNYGKGFDDRSSHHQEIENI